MTLLRLARSVRLTVVLLAIAAGYVVVALLLDFGFRTPVFIAILAVFGLNLVSCTAHRLLFRPHRRVRDYLPDLIHTSLLVLLLGAVGSLVGRSERPITLSPGDRFTLDGRYELTLTETVRTDHNWISRLTIRDAEEGRERTAETRVNSPLRVAGFRIYQTRWAEVPVVELRYRDGRTFTMAEDEGFRIGDDLFVLEVVEGPAEEAIPFDLVWFRDKRELGRMAVRRGTRLGDLEVIGVSRLSRSVLTVVRDPGVPIALIGGLMLAFTTMTLALVRAREFAG